jgi:hypothetical protein
VFKNNGGFDVVIGNPPYGGEKITNDLKEHLGLTSKDAYGAFISNAINGTNSTLKNNGFLSFIVSDTFMTIKSHLALRKQILNQKLQRVIRLHLDTFKATVNTAIILVQKTDKKLDVICEVADFTNISVHEEYDLFLKILEETRYKQQMNISTERYSIFYYPQKLIYTNSNLSFFMCHPKLFRLMNDKILEESVNISVKIRKIKLNESTVELVRLGDISDVKQGLATGDNKYYLYQNPESRGNYKSIKEYKEFVLTNAELKSIVNNSELRLKVIKQGLHKSVDEKNFDNSLYFDGRYIVPYDKGGESNSEDGWLPNYNVPTDYYIDWSQESIERMNSLTIKERNAINGKNGGSDNQCAVIRSSHTYFNKGITSSRVGAYSPTYRESSDSIYDSGCGNIFCTSHEREFVLGILSSKLIKCLFKSAINHTVNSQVDDAKELPFVLKSNQLIINLVSIVIDKQKQNNRYDYMSNEQKEIDGLVYELYGLNKTDIQEVEKWYARRYPKLRKWCYISEDATNAPS